MGRDQRHRAGSFVHLATLDADGPVLDHVDTPDSIGARQPVHLGDQSREPKHLTVERDRDTALEADHDLEGRRRGPGIRRERVRLVRRSVPRILEDPGLDRPPEQVFVDGVRRRGRLDDGDAASERVLDFLVPRPDPIAQRSDDLHARVVGLEGELEAKLVVALSRAAVDDGLGAELQGDLCHRLRDDGPR